MFVFLFLIQFGTSILFLRSAAAILNNNYALEYLCLGETNSAINHLARERLSPLERAAIEARVACAPDGLWLSLFRLGTYICC